VIGVAVGVAAIVFLLVLVWALCRMAAAGDRHLEDARDALETERHRRVGL
jgi:hypothetical protein